MRCGVESCNSVSRVYKRWNPPKCNYEWDWDRLVGKSQLSRWGKAEQKETGLKSVFLKITAHKYSMYLSLDIIINNLISMNNILQSLSCEEEEDGGERERENNKQQFTFLPGGKLKFHLQQSSKNKSDR